LLPPIAPIDQEPKRHFQRIGTIVVFGHRKIPQRLHQQRRPRRLMLEAQRVLRYVCP
jgi:hypothetical protein